MKTIMIKQKVIAEAKRFADNWLVTYTRHKSLPLEVRLIEGEGGDEISVKSAIPLDANQNYLVGEYQRVLIEWYRQILEQSS